MSGKADSLLQRLGASQFKTMVQNQDKLKHEKEWKDTQLKCEETSVKIKELNLKLNKAALVFEGWVNLRKVN